MNSFSVDLVWTTHLAWCLKRGVTSQATRVLDTADLSRWAATTTGQHLDLTYLDDDGKEAESEAPAVDLYRLPADVDLPPELVTALGGLGNVARVRTTELWEAILVGVCQMATVASPRRTYRCLSQWGESVPLSTSPIYRMAPSPITILDQEQTLPTTGLGEAAPVLLSAAEAYLTHGDTWHAAAPGDLITGLQAHIDGLDTDTAHHIAVDVTGDFEFYPVASLEFRAWHTVPHHAPYGRPAPTGSPTTGKPAQARTNPP